MNTSSSVTAPQTVTIRADHESVQHLADSASALRYDLRVRSGSVILDLRGVGQDASEIEVDLDVRRGVVTLLVADDAVVSDDAVEFGARAKVKQTFHSRKGDGSAVVLSGRIDRGEVRVHSGGIAVLRAVTTRRFFGAARAAHVAGTSVTLHDPARLGALANH